MTFKEIASRITGVSTSVFGISWNPPILEKKIAEKTITFLEGKRVLYNPFDLESPKHCTQSVIQIKDFITEQLFELDRDSELRNILSAMRYGCNRFLDVLEKNKFYFTDDGDIDRGSFGGQILFFSGIGELRSTFGYLIAQILIIFKLDCESDLLGILPLKTDNS